MTDTLFIGARAYSSWSLRGWLCFAHFGLPVRIVEVGLYTGTFSADLAPAAPARLVPALLTGEGEPQAESLAIAETLAERFPGAGLWPADPAARMRARWLAAEMHSGFGALRAACPMDLRRAYEGFVPDDAVRADLERIEIVWRDARTRFGGDGPWLCGKYSVADAFFAPVAARIATYDLPVGPEAEAYCAAHLSDMAFRQWRAMALAEPDDPAPYLLDLPPRPWPGPAPEAAEALSQGTAENAACPYSGDPVRHLMVSEGRVFGFANAFCRDKTVADPEAWPAFTALRGAASGEPLTGR